MAGVTAKLLLVTVKIFQGLWKQYVNVYLERNQSNFCLQIDL